MLRNDFTHAHNKQKCSKKSKRLQENVIGLKIWLIVLLLSFLILIL